MNLLTQCRPLAFAAVTGALLFVGSTGAASADVEAAPQKAKHQMKAETIDQRIADLHKSLQITADEEPNWAAVAQVMRDNDAALKALVAARTADDRGPVSAVDDLKMYQKFAQAHVDGLAKLTASFETLYSAMPDPQKLVADGVFRSVGEKHAQQHAQQHASSAH